MTSNTKLTQSEIRQVQLDMLDEVDAFCKKNNIKYSLAFGTMLGAIRHKGYIPWDDDMDIIMPLPDFLKFKKNFKSNKIQYLDIDNIKYYEWHFSRIAYKETYNKIGLFKKSYGVCIDIYPVVGMPDNEKDVLMFLNRMQSLAKMKKKVIKLKRFMDKYLFVTYLPYYQRVMRKWYETIIFSYPYENANYFLHAGSIRRVNIFNFNVFEKLVDYDFEGHYYLGPEKYHDYLSQCYGDYMKLPPEKDRKPYHVFNYYWR